MPPSWLLLRPGQNEFGWVQRLLRHLYYGAFRCIHIAQDATETLVARRRQVTGWSLSVLLAAVLIVAAMTAYRIAAPPPWALADGARAEEVTQRVLAYRETMTSLLAVLIQTAAGIILGFGLFATWQQLRSAREAQLTDRFSRAVNLLANERLDIRVAGIENLERIALAHESERQPVLRLLSAFVTHRFREPLVREGTPWPLPLDLRVAIGTIGRLQKLSTEYSAALASIRGLDLSGVDLSGLTLRGFDMFNATLDDADLTGADFRWAQLGRASFKRATLSGTDFTRSWVYDTDFTGATMENATLYNIMGHAIFRDANLNGANFFCAIIAGSDFRGATIGCANLDMDLRNLNFQGVDLSKARGILLSRLGVAQTDEHTVLPSTNTHPYR